MLKMFLSLLFRLLIFLILVENGINNFFWLFMLSKVSCFVFKIYLRVTYIILLFVIGIFATFLFITLLPTTSLSLHFFFNIHLLIKLIFKLLSLIYCFNSLFSQFFSTFSWKSSKKSKVIFGIYKNLK